MEKFPAKARRERAMELLAMAKKLPERVDPLTNNFDKIVLYAVDLRKQTWGFVKTGYGQESKYFKKVDSFDFVDVSDVDDVMHRIKYFDSRAALFELLEKIEAEEIERAKLERKMIDNSIPLRYGLCFLGIALSWISIWSAPPEVMGKIFSEANFLAARILLSLVTSLTLLIIIAKEHWIPLVAIAVGLLGTAWFVLKTDKPEQSQKEHKDSLHQTERTMLLDSIKKLNSPKR